MTDGTPPGEPFNTQTVTGLGIEKTLQITYDVVTNMLTSAADYQDYGNDLRQACSDLVGQHEITAGDCEQVQKVVLATEMAKPPAKATPATASVCAPGQTAVPAFFDDLENSEVDKRWQSESLEEPPGPDVFFFSQESAEEAGFDATYATSGTGNIWGFDYGEISDSAIAMTKSIKVPSGGLMHFDHAHGFETGEGQDFDGGVIEYSTDGGAHWHDAGSLIEAGDDYGGTISEEAGNPLAGEPAFVGDSAGYGSTRLNLSSLAGNQVRFRFRLGTDQAQEDYGWFIDNVEIYHCDGGEGSPPPPPAEGTPASSSSAAPVTPVPAPNRCAAAHAALVRAQAKVARLRRRLRAMRPPTDGARKAVRTATANVRRKRAAARRACGG